MLRAARGAHSPHMYEHALSKTELIQDCELEVREGRADLLAASALGLWYMEQDYGSTDQVLIIRLTFCTCSASASCLPFTVSCPAMCECYISMQLLPRHYHG